MGTKGICHREELCWGPLIFPLNPTVIHTASQLGGKGLRETEWPSHPTTGASIPRLPQHGLWGLVSGMWTGAPQWSSVGMKLLGEGFCPGSQTVWGDRGA